MCTLIINCCVKYSCSLSVWPVVDVEGAVLICCEVFGPVSVHDVLKQPLSGPFTEVDHSGSAMACSPRLPGPICWHNGVYFQKEGTLNQLSPSSSQIPSVLLSFPLYLSVALSLSLLSLCLFEQCLHSIHFPLISLVCSHSLITLFSLCAKCQVCQWRYLQEN